MEAASSAVASRIGVTKWYAWRHGGMNLQKVMITKCKCMYNFGVYIYIHIYIYTKYQCTHNTHIHTYNHWGNDHARVMWAVDGLFAERTVQPIAIKPIWPNPECACSVGSFSIEQAQLSGIDLMGGGTISQGELVPYSTVLFANFKHQVTWHEPSSFLCFA
jgi:hypothetical protein